ncbi:hypothetical protein G4V62_18545 [Bacillaceae bacterium SIJ1]|nr:hypothetical protein [Litoribacterium kuwaitense]
MRQLAAGFTANIDHVVHMTQAILSFVEERSKQFTVVTSPPPKTVATWEQLWSVLTWHLGDVDGGEYIVTDPAILEAFVHHFTGVRQVGGTGLQAGCAASAAGYDAIVHLPRWRGSDLLPQKHFDGEGDCGEPPVHVIFEYQAGERLERGVVQQSNRVILRGLDEFSIPLIHEPFQRRLLQERPPWLLASGYTSIDDALMRKHMMTSSIPFFKRLQQLGTAIYLELADVLQVSVNLDILQTLGSEVDVVGMNEEELGRLIQQQTANWSVQQWAKYLPSLPEQFGVQRLLVHTSRFAVIVTSDSDEEWAFALRQGNGFAAARAVKGSFASREEIEDIANQYRENDFGVRLRNELITQQNITVAPAFQIVPKRTIGLGDTFTAGVLLGAPLLYERS